MSDLGTRNFDTAYLRRQFDRIRRRAFEEGRPIDTDAVRHLVEALRLNAQWLADLVASGRERFVSDESIYLQAERCLQLAIQSMLDIGTHVIAAEGLVSTIGYERIIPELGRAGILPAVLVERLAGIAGLRNILVHDYLEVDHGRLFDDLTTGLPDFDEFARAISAFLAARP